jgi:hypothetical protein
MELSKNCKITNAISPTAGAAGATDINGATLDMQGFEGALMVVTFGAITAGAVTGIRAAQGAASDLSDAADLAGSAQVIADSDDDKTFYIDVKKPAERYVRLVVDRATQNAVVAAAWYIQYGAHKAPTTHGANVAGETHVSPAEGTA